MPAWGADRTARPLLALILAAALAAPAAAQTTTDLVSRSAFRVCSDPANMPFSNEAGEGFENRIAELFAESFGRELEYTWFPMAPGFVRRTLAANRCDVIVGYAQGDELVLNTNHYYTSTHVLLTRADGDLADVSSLADPRLKGRAIGVIAGSPPASYLARYGLMTDVHGYQLMVDRRVDNPNERMLADLLSGEIDAALMWGPIGGPLVKAQGEAVAMAPLLDQPPPGAPRLSYRITMGVRAGEDAWKRELNSKIRELQPRIDAVLTEYGVPLVNDMGTGLKETAEASTP